MGCPWTSYIRKVRASEEALALEAKANLQDAIIFATQAHEKQTDKAGLPYILHPISVMNRIPEEDVVGRTVAILHDVMEDCGVRWETLYLRYGAEVANAVRDLSCYKGESYKGFLGRVMLNPLARRVKIQDIRDNLARPVLPGDEEWKRSMTTKRYLPALRVLEQEEE